MSQKDSGFDEQSEIVPVSDGRDSEAFIITFSERYRLNLANAAAAIADVQEEFLPEQAGAGGSRPELWRLRGLIERGVLQKQSYVKNGGAAQLADRSLWLILGFPTLAGAADMAALGKLLGCQKQTVNKCVQFFQEQIPELPLLPEQRDGAARASMSRARINQLPGNDKS